MHTQIKKQTNYQGLKRALNYALLIMVLAVVWLVTYHPDWIVIPPGSR